MRAFVGLILLLSFIPLAFGELRDPTRPADYSAKLLAPEKMKLSAIFQSDHQWRAFLNGNLVKVGDHVDGYRVTQISAESVYLADHEGDYMVSLTPSITRSVVP